MYQIWAVYWKVALDHWISSCLIDGHTRMTSTHLDTPGLDTPGWLVLTRKPYMEDIPASLGSTWNGHTWSHGYTWSGHTWMTFTHMDGLKSLDTPGRFGHTWKHWTLEPWNLLWILPDNSYGFFQIPWISMTHDLTGKDVFWKVIKWQEHWLMDQCRYPILLHWRMWSPSTPGHML